MPVDTIVWTGHSVRIIDQTQLPKKLTYLDCRDVKTLWQAIKILKVRGAPALGVAAAFGVLLGIKDYKGQSRKAFDKYVLKLCDYLASSRPTAVNLFYALNQMRGLIFQNPSVSISEMKIAIASEAVAIFEEDRAMCRAMGKQGAKLIKNGMTALTVCNAGALATSDYGTALGVFYAAKEAKKKFKVFSLETRPLLQGSRLTCWELQKNKIDVTLICDNMAATCMKQGKIDIVFTGADRIAANGDVANKIGTYMLAVLAKHHSVPFYVVAPKTTFDLNISTGKEIPIEERDSKEVTHFGLRQTAPNAIKVYNPAFDVTDHTLISGIVTETGMIRAPFKSNISKMLKR